MFVRSHATFDDLRRAHCGVADIYRDTRRWLIALGALQTADCVTTRDIMRTGGYEENPFARIAGASSSLPMCLIESAALDVTVARMGRNTVLVLTGLETLAVHNNLRVLLEIGSH